MANCLQIQSKFVFLICVHNQQLYLKKGLLIFNITFDCLFKRTKTKQTDAKEEKQLKDFTKCFADHFNLCIKGLRKRHIKYWDNIQDDRV